jgi:hypothetical protein
MIWVKKHLYFLLYHGHGFHLSECLIYKICAHHDNTEIRLKLALNTHQSINQSIHLSESRCVENKYPLLFIWYFSLIYNNLTTFTSFFLEFLICSPHLVVQIKIEQSTVEIVIIHRRQKVYTFVNVCDWSLPIQFFVMFIHRQLYSLASKQCIWMYTVWQCFVMPVDNNWHCPAKYICNVSYTVLPRSIAPSFIAKILVCPDFPH